MKKLIIAILLVGAMAWQTATASAEPISNRITVTVRGKGPDVVLIPGLGCSNAVWDGTVKQLQGRYRLHVVQVAGFAGASARGNAKGAVCQPTVDAIDAYIKTNKLKSPKVIGHSLGGLMGMMIAAQHPGDVGKLMIVDSLPFFSVLMGVDSAAGATPGAIMMRETILNESQEDFVQSQGQFLQAMVKSPAGLKKVSAWSAASNKSVVAQAMYEAMTTDLRPKLKEIKTLVTMVYPWDESMGRPVAEVDAFYRDNYKELSNKTMVRIDGGYHFVMIDQPEKFAKQLETFLK